MWMKIYIIGSCEDMILKCLSVHDDHDENISNKEACMIYLLETFMSIVWYYYLHTHYFVWWLYFTRWEKNILNEHLTRVKVAISPVGDAQAKWMANWFIYMYAWMWMKGLEGRCDAWESMYSWEMKRCIKCLMTMAWE